MSKERDHVSIRIEEKLSDLSHTSSEAESYIYRVYSQLRKVNEEAYEPVIIAIGPYHRGKDNLQEMEKLKLRYFQQLLKRQEGTSVDKYVMAIRELEERARKCYAETINLNTDEFVEMMLLDGCFIVELFCKVKMEKLRDGNDPIFQSDQVSYGLQRDLLLLENQLPFFILVKLFNMIEVPSLEENIIQLALYCLESVVPNGNLEAPNEIQIDDIKHLLGLVHDSWCFSFANSLRNAKDKPEDWEYINSATELEEAGVKFKKVERSSLFDIKFTNGVLEIPPLVVSEYTESPLRNLIAYEQYSSSDQPNYISDYIVFMDCLINSPQDVQLLRRRGVIVNDIGDDGMVYAMVNWMNQFILISAREKDYSYSKIFYDVNKHCGRRRNEWMATLRRKYFNNPWAWVSFLAALVLLVLTVIQTIFSGLSLS